MTSLTKYRLSAIRREEATKRERLGDDLWYRCGRKKPYRNKAEADHRIACINNGRLQSFLCRDCGKWHIGKAKRQT